MAQYVYEPEQQERREMLRMKLKNDDKPKINQMYRYDQKLTRDLVFGNRLVRVWSPEAEHDKDTLRAFKNLAKYPEVFPYIAIMPDYHIGENSVNGAIIPTRQTLYVNAIGEDIGCGMASLRLPVRVEDINRKLDQIYNRLYSRIPSGRRLNITYEDRIDIKDLFKSDLEVLNNANTKEAKQQMGTLGSGNHFVEVQIDENGYINLMVHTGSRRLGQNIRKIFSRKGKVSNSSIGLVALDANSSVGVEYLAHVDFATEYARENRKEIMLQVYQTISEILPRLLETQFEKLLEDLIDTTHNQITRETHFGEQVYVHRKGAVHLPGGALGLIPGSMGSGSYVVRSKGNRFSFDSCSHGAGRRMSRGRALNSIRLEDYLKAMQGIVCRTDDNILDEAPQAYKDIDTVLKYQKDLVSIVNKLRPLVSIKG